MTILLYIFFFINYIFFSRTLMFELTVPDFRYTEDFPDSQVTKVPYTNTASKSAEEEKSHVPKKVGTL